jgi:hypothetical protein
MENLTPVIDPKVIQEKINEFALKGAIETIKDFYTGYKSPFREAVDASLKATKLNYKMELPDIIGMINQSIVAEMDKITHEAISKTYVPLVKRFLTRIEPKMTFSDFLRELIEDADIQEPDDCSIDMNKHSQYDWYEIDLKLDSVTYKMTLHECSESRRDKTGSTQKTYQFLSLPSGWEKESTGLYRSSVTNHRIMKLKVDNATLELPYTPEVLHDPVCRLIAQMMLCDTQLTLDTTDFDDDMFPNRCHCD